MRRLKDYLDDLRDELDAVEQFTKEGKAAFLSDDRTQYAVMMAYARIGEIAKHIPVDVLETQPQIEWKRLKGFRDILLHRYFEINIGRVWEAGENLPALRAAVETLLASLPLDEETPD